MMPEWITVKEAAELLGISRRQVINRIHEGKLRARRERTIWLLHRTLSEPDEEEALEVATTSGKFREEVTYLGEQIDQRDSQIRELQEQLREKDKALEEAHREAAEASQRHDMIVMQLTRQLEQSQRLLEYHQEPWYRRWFRKGHRPEEG